MQASSDAVIFVMSNRGYAIEQAFVDLEAFDPHGVFAPFDNLPTWDYLALAQAFGARGVRLTNPTELFEFLPSLSSPADGPTLVEVVVPKHDLARQLKRLAESPVTMRRRSSRDGHLSWPNLRNLLKCILSVLKIAEVVVAMG